MEEIQPHHSSFYHDKTFDVWVTFFCLCVLSLCLCLIRFVHLTDQGVCDVGPVNAVLQFQLVMGLYVQQQVLVEAHAGDQVCTVGTLQGATAVDVLDGQREMDEIKLNWNVCGTLGKIC